VDQGSVIAHDGHELGRTAHHLLGRPRRAEDRERGLSLRVCCPRALEAVYLLAEALGGGLGRARADNGGDDGNTVQAVPVDRGHGAVQQEGHVRGVDAAWSEHLTIEKFVFRSGGEQTAA